MVWHTCWVWVCAFGWRMAWAPGYNIGAMQILLFIEPFWYGGLEMGKVNVLARVYMYKGINTRKWHLWMVMEFFSLVLLWLVLLLGSLVCKTLRDQDHKVNIPLVVFRGKSSWRNAHFPREKFTHMDAAKGFHMADLSFFLTVRFSPQFAHPSKHSIQAAWMSVLIKTALCNNKMCGIYVWYKTLLHTSLLQVSIWALCW